MGNRIHAEIIQAWRQQGVDAEVITLTAGLQQQVSAIEAGIMVHRLPVSAGLPLKIANRAFGLALHYPYLAGALWHYRRFLQTHTYDLVHVETAFPLGLVAALVPRNLHPPLAVTLPGADIMAEPVYDYGYGRFWTVRSLLPFVFRRADVLRADSPLLRDLAIRLGANPAHVTAIPYNITADSYPAAHTNIEQLRAQSRTEVVARHGLDPARPIVVSLSRLHPFKGVAYLVEALPAVRQAGVQPQVLIVGPSRKTPRFGDYSDYLIRRAADLHVADAVVLVGAVEHAATLTYLAAADVVVVPSVAESFNRVAVEAAAIGTPAVVTWTTGVSVYIKEYTCGLGIEPCSADAIATALVQLLTDRQMWRDFSARAIPLAAKFDSTTIASALLDLYHPYLSLDQRSQIESALC